MDDATRAEIEAIRKRRDSYLTTHDSYYGAIPAHRSAEDWRLICQWRETYAGRDVDRTLAIIDEQERANAQLIQTLSTRAKREIEMLETVRTETFDEAIGKVKVERDKWLARLLNSDDPTFKYHYQTRADAATEIITELETVKND